mmetsp:Transcript_8294/g.18222  ORF Transcript_8294/g.18222 Transcript_8294/m.18222 type:complete len:354 (-) Transcript_8294:33-1094(-)
MQLHDEHQSLCGPLPHLKQTHDLRVLLLLGPVPRRHAVLVLRFRVRASSQQHPHDVLVPLVGCAVQGGVVVLVHGVLVRLLHQQQAHNVSVAAVRRPEQRRQPVLVAQLNVRTLLDELLHDLQVAHVRRPQQSSQSVLVRGIHEGLGFGDDQLMYHIHVAVGSSPVHRCGSVLVGDVHVRSRPHQLPHHIQMARIGGEMKRTHAVLVHHVHVWLLLQHGLHLLQSAVVGSPDERSGVVLVRLLLLDLVHPDLRVQRDSNSLLQALLLLLPPLERLGRRRLPDLQIRRSLRRLKLRRGLESSQHGSPLLILRLLLNLLLLPGLLDGQSLPHAQRLCLRLLLGTQGGSFLLLLLG